MSRRPFLAVPAVLFGLACLALVLPRPFLMQADDAPAATRRVLVLANAIHTDIALPPDRDVVERFGFLAADGLPLTDPAIGWILFGWGGRQFYLETPSWAELKPGPVFKALTIDSSVMHVALAGPIEPAMEGVLAIDLMPAAFEQLLLAIEGSFQDDAAGRPLLVSGRSYGDFDLFYEAHGSFHAIVGCNTWTAGVLRRAGLRTSWWNPLPANLIWSLETYNDLPVPASP